MKRVAMLLVVVGCGGGESPDPAAACTPEEQEVAGAQLTFAAIDLGFMGQQPAATHLITTSDQLATEFGGTPPAQLDDIDFATDRIVLGSSNPAVQFVILESGGDLVVGQEPLCQGAAPGTVGYVLRGNTSDVLGVITCPYRGPDPCLAP